MNFDDALLAAVTVDVTGEAEWDSLNDLDLMELLGLVAEARRQKRLADLIRNAATSRAVGVLGEGSAVSDGRVLYRVTPKSTRKVKDPVELIQWLGPTDAATVIRMDYALSIEAFRGLCQARGVDPVEQERHFFTVTWGEPELTEIPLDNARAPRYAASMIPGEIRRRETR